MKIKFVSLSYISILSGGPVYLVDKKTNKAECLYGIVSTNTVEKDKGCHSTVTKVPQFKQWIETTIELFSG